MEGMSFLVQGFRVRIYCSFSRINAFFLIADDSKAATFAF